MTRTSDMPEYQSWENMRQRCNNPNCPDFYMYGAVGVTVCDRWSSFARFLQDLGPRPPGTSLDRIKGDRGYEPGNVRWATPMEQADNRKTTRRITHLGRTQSLSAWAREFSLNPSLVIMRYRMGWTMERALGTPARKYR